MEEHSKDWFDKSLGIFITICKDINILKFVSTEIDKVFGKVTRRKGGYPITLKYPKGIITYQKHIGGFDS